MAKKKEKLVKESATPTEVLDELINEMSNKNIVATEDMPETTELYPPMPEITEEVQDIELAVESPDIKKVYRCIITGTYSIPIIVYNKYGEEIKKYVRFKNNTYVTSDEQEITALDKIIYEEQSNNTYVGKRKVLTDEEYTSLVTPEKLYVNIAGDNIHITEVREAYNFAIKMGFSPKKKKDIFILNKPKSKISRGGTASAGSVDG